MLLPDSRYHDDVITHHVIGRDLDVDGCKGQNWLAGRLSLPASCLRWPMYVTCTTVDCELCILERCRASFVQHDHAHLRT